MLTEAVSRRRSFTDMLFRVSATPVEQLTSIEQRLLLLSKTFFPDILLQVRIAEATAAAGVGTIDFLPAPSQGAVGHAARCAIAAAIEVELPLRELRDKLNS